jgi:hypothetical protein
MPNLSAELDPSNRTPVALRIFISVVSRQQNSKEKQYLLLRRSVHNILAQLPLWIPMHVLRQRHSQQPLRLDDARNHVVLLRQLAKLGPIPKLLLIGIRDQI